MTPAAAVALAVALAAREPQPVTCTYPADALVDDGALRRVTAPRGGAWWMARPDIGCAHARDIAVSGPNGAVALTDALYDGADVLALPVPASANVGDVFHATAGCGLSLDLTVTGGPLLAADPFVVVSSTVTTFAATAPCAGECIDVTNGLCNDLAVATAVPGALALTYTGGPVALDALGPDRNEPARDLPRANAETTVNLHVGPGCVGVPFAVHLVAHDPDSVATVLDRLLTGPTVERPLGTDDKPTCTELRNGCGCSSDGDAAPALAFALALGLAGAVRRRSPRGRPSSGA